MGQPFLSKIGRPWLIGGAIAIGLGSLAFSLNYWQQRQRVNEEQAIQAALANPMSDRITALGRLEPEGEVVAVSAPSMTERLGQLLVREGDRVVAGQPLAYLDTYPERKAERDLAASQLQEARLRYEAETRLAVAQIAEAERRRDRANEPAIAAIQAQQATIQRIQAELETANREYQRFAQLFADGAVSQQDLDDRTVRVRSLQEELRNAQANLVRLQEERRTELATANAQVDAAQANLGRVQTQVQLLSAERNLQLAEARLERTIIRAPRNGRVLRIHTRAGETINERGILELGNTDQMYAVAEVYETDVPRVRVGQPAEIRSSALSAPLSGRVAQVGLVVAKNDVTDTDPAAKTDARVVEVKIRLDNSEPVAGLTNMQVEIAIDPR
ncbi:ABC exporter membrane fusion protein [Thermosynechococcus sp. QKsg1]|uniref:ABC exporter membrane fusion protein n=1 Tax=unclassified Thermosynechococcus TaxID=2622553 RepID=UPI002578236E|nr:MULTISPECIES: ABC exporter membrane fusion protein [unclassified Thermosynechococcus]WJI23575.1 ABC exporter membrane fusion protein [Thermosynechococcus sp. B0]WJI26090.1 ABC exporter membrane fusion protein [Thermosynechococcus sp. B1]WJI28617.1 ABC exporter membrane fusion protein [Thermosynechococcus sp. B3]WNC86210.1 ABC exporter membrane fusion protein [Thermosynechococcus sp. QKsg1]